MNEEEKNNSEQVEKSARSIRACSYNASANMIEVSYEDKKELYLEVKYRVLWFLTYCQEHGLTGLIDDSDVRYLPDAQMLVATTVIYIDGAVVGKSTAGIPYAAGDQIRAVQMAATAAKGRALANAGFGTVSYSSEDGDIPCDAGIPFVGGNVSFKKLEEQKDETAKIKITDADARSYVIPMGQYKGRTLGEVLAMDKKTVDYYASDKFNAGEQFPELVMSAKTLVIK